MADRDAGRTRPSRVPAPRRRLMPRDRLTDRLVLPETARPRLLLVSAPAGFGKTTLMSQWLSAEEARGNRVIWLSLEPADSDLHRFLTRLLSALEARIDGFGAGLRALLDTTQTPSVEAVVGDVVTELDELEEPTVIALDDYHVIDASAVHEAVTFLVENLPPRSMLAIATRADPALPVARLRSRGELMELRADDLRFTTDEAGTFLHDVMGLELEREQVAVLDARTEGWAAGLQLAALSLRGHDDPERFVEAFAGSHRFVLDYLVEEVLAGQPAEVRQFLLDTSVLSRLNGDLCDALTGHTNGRQLLEELERANVFVVPLDEHRRWYRYHHLFADALRARLVSEQPDRVPSLHQAASRWFAGTGDLEAAITHALAADPDAAADLVELAIPGLRKRRGGPNAAHLVARAPGRRAPGPGPARRAARLGAAIRGGSRRRRSMAGRRRPGPGERPRRRDRRSGRPRRRCEGPGSGAPHTAGHHRLVSHGDGTGHR
jgi:LuxR family transcriptional regulator, maltose regulon positive regulatory protein